MRRTCVRQEHFQILRDIHTRWMDVDIYGHVNNVQYLSFFDTAVNGWYIDKGLQDPHNRKRAAPCQIRTRTGAFS